MLPIAILLAAAPAKCGDQPTQTGMTMCFKREADAADAQLNAQWRRTLAYMQGRDKSDGPPPKGEMTYTAALMASQRAWLAFRDNECRVESYENLGGSAQPMTYNQCMVDVVRARTRQLHDLVWEQ